MLSWNIYIKCNVAYTVILECKCILPFETAESWVEILLETSLNNFLQIN